MDIVFNVNKLGLVGLGSTLTSLIRNCSNNIELKLWFLCSELNEKDKNNILLLLQLESFMGCNEFININAKQTFGHLKSLHGDWTTYGKLLIPSIIRTESALYLDADLIIQLDILKIKNFSPNKMISAVCGSTVQWAYDNFFFIRELKWKPDTAYFNAGVLFLNLRKWREDHIDEKIKYLYNKFPYSLLSHDQTLFNSVCEGDFTHLPEEFNTPWYPVIDKPRNSKEVIIHFVGSPKPWDMFGKEIHQGYNTWKTYNTPFWKNSYNKLTFNKIRRTWKIRRSIYRALRIKYQEHNRHHGFI